MSFAQSRPGLTTMRAPTGGSLRVFQACFWLRVFPASEQSPACAELVEAPTRC